MHVHTHTHTHKITWSYSTQNQYVSMDRKQNAIHDSSVERKNKQIRANPDSYTRLFHYFLFSWWINLVDHKLSQLNIYSSYDAHMLQAICNLD
jgi:hypothetical protein